MRLFSCVLTSAGGPGKEHERAARSFINAPSAVARWRERMELWQWGQDDEAQLLAELARIKAERAEEAAKAAAEVAKAAQDDVRQEVIRGNPLVRASPPPPPFPRLRKPRS